MLNSVEVFLAHLLDYAGLFPPAKLPMQEALHHYLRYRRSSPRAWMLGRFVCPVSKLNEVCDGVRSTQDADLMSITALGQQSSTAEGVLPTLDADLRAIQNFRHVWGSEKVVDTVELAMPKDVPAESLIAALAAFRSRLEEAKLQAFLEIPRQSSWRAMTEKICQSLRGQTVIGLKLRCGGTVPEMFPGNEEVAQFILCCRDAQLPWKATAGLHHPRRFWDASLQLWHHGFLNVFGAGVLALSQPLNETDIVAILADRQCEQFQFDALGLAWKEWKCPVDQLSVIRSRWLSSFGTCSFDEPVEDLEKMNLI